ncbi:hypothetical protein K443DRAFT_363314 [Laccaria amethystina LaAM-08-1]|uniref:Unplaced genomic scaffold K443scaffold_263, whole genome shotgun sequence n=1 Tax=Laccaria amethystina LaAM-08-1 TaxID=1095629 RepID=A0A0C9WZE6_9AGAR|nr:hypothetical protein K443DRAFT_363314 [Laccaria amethystina LaAM-08-1]
MENLAATLRSLGKYKEADKLVIQAQEVNSRVIGATSPYAIATMANVQEAQDISIMNFDKKVYSLSNLIKKTSKIMSKIAHSFHIEKAPNDDLAGISS